MNSAVFFGTGMPAYWPVVSDYKVRTASQAKPEAVAAWTDQNGFSGEMSSACNLFFYFLGMNVTLAGPPFLVQRLRIISGDNLRE